MTGSATIIRGDARALPLAENSVDLVVTSPPYFGLRSYVDNGVHYEGQIGDEATPAEFIAALLDVTRECARVLKPAGSMFVNLGDSYARRGVAGGDSGVARTGGQPRIYSNTTRFVPEKSLILIPERYRIACVDQLGLIARAVIVWDKPNGLPESVTDRVRRSHEDWVHLTLQPRYYSAVDEIRETYAPATLSRNLSGRASHTPADYVDTSRGVLRDARAAGHDGNPLGKLPDSVWEIPTQPLNAPKWRGEESGHPHSYFFGKSHDAALEEAERWAARFPGRSLTRMTDHFAAYPPEWPRRIIRGWSPPGVCTACGEGRRPVATRSEPYNPHQNRFVQTARPEPHGGSRANTTLGWQRDVTVTGYTCACPDTTAPTTPAVILDPFGGTGTTALVAKALGRHGISVDMSADYCRLAEWRTNDPGELARAMQVDKPPVQLDGQLGMFEEESA